MQPLTPPLERTQLRANGLLLITAVIWGSAFVFQRVGMEFVGPLTFNGVRFLIGGLTLLPLIAWLRRGKPRVGGDRSTLVSGLILGVILFGGATMQQAGLVYTTAGKAGFITGLYIVIIPILGLFFRQRSSPAIWVGTAVAAVGLYLLSFTDQMTIERGDLLVLIGAFIWAVHVLAISVLAPRQDPIQLACIQFLVAGALSLLLALFFEPISASGLRQAGPAILYTALLSTAVGYTLQVVGQRHAHPASAALIMSLESVFALIGGWLLLSETIGTRGLIGCGLMMAGMLLAQLQPQRNALDAAAAAD